jgi:hypothetical protein
MPKEFFPRRPAVSPSIYAYEEPGNAGLEAIREIAVKGEYDEFDLNVFFSAEESGADARFKYEEYVQKWLDLIRGAFQETTVDNLKLGAKKPPLPFADVQLLENLTHTFWFLPSVSACHAMHNLIEERNNTFSHDYTTIVAAGSQCASRVEPPWPFDSGSPSSFFNSSTEFTQLIRLETISAFPSGLPPS